MSRQTSSLTARVPPALVLGQLDGLDSPGIRLFSGDSLESCY